MIKTEKDTRDYIIYDNKEFFKKLNDSNYFNKCIQRLIKTEKDTRNDIIHDNKEFLKKIKILI